MFVMKIFLSILILIFSFQTSSKADSVKNLKIEDFSIGESLLKYFSKDEILKNTNTNIFQVEDKKFVSFFTDHPVVLKTYDQYEYIRVTYLNNENFLIHGVTGMKDFEKSDMYKCYELQKKIEIEFDNAFSNLRKTKDVFPLRVDATGESQITGIYYNADDGYAEISCYDFAKHINIVSGIDVGIFTTELGDWISDLRND